MKKDSLITMQYPNDSTKKNHFFDGKAHTIKPIAIKPLQQATIKMGKYLSIKQQLYILAYYDVNMKKYCFTIVSYDGNTMQKIPLKDYKLLTKYLKKQPFTAKDKYELSNLTLPSYIGLAPFLDGNQIFNLNGTIKEPIDLDFFLDNSQIFNLNDTKKTSEAVAAPLSPPKPPSPPPKKLNQSKEPLDLDKRIICVVPYYIDEQQNYYISDRFFTYQTCDAQADGISYHYEGTEDYVLKSKILYDFREFTFPTIKLYKNNITKPNLNSTIQDSNEKRYSVFYYANLVPCDSLQKLEAVSKASKIIVNIPYSYSQLDGTSVLAEACNGSLPMKTIEGQSITPENEKLAYTNCKTTSFDSRSKQYH